MVPQILQQFAKIPIEGTVLTYALSYQPITAINEVDPRLFNQHLLIKTNSGLSMAYPRTNFETLDMEAVLPEKSTVFMQTTRNLTEPDRGRILDPAEIDLVLLPLLTFDTKGNRVGYGKGFYDRYLARCRPDTLKIGLSYLPPVRQIEDVNRFDIPLDYCVTPDQLYEFK